MPIDLASVAPPPTPGAGSTTPDEKEILVRCAKDILSIIANKPYLAKQLNPIVESLTKVIRQSLPPGDVPAFGGEAAQGPPMLTRTPPGAPLVGAGDTLPGLLARVAGPMMGGGMPPLG